MSGSAASSRAAKLAPAGLSAAVERFTTYLQVECGLAASTLERSPRPAWTAKLLLGETWWDVARTAAWAAAPGEGWYASRGAERAERRGTHPLRAMLR